MREIPMIWANTKQETIPSLFTSLMLALLSAFLLLFHSWDQILTGYEGYYAQMARELYQTGQWLIPTFLGKPVLDQPPLLPWLVSWSYQLGGVNAGMARLPGWVAGLLTVQLTYALGRELRLGWVASLGALILCEFYLWVYVSRGLGPEVIWTCLNLLGLCCLLKAGKQGWRLAALVWGLMLGLGLLLVGGSALVALVAAVPYLWFYDRRHQLLQNPYFYMGLGLGLLLFGLWFWAAYQSYGSAIYGVLGTWPTLPSASDVGLGLLFTLPWSFIALAEWLVMLLGGPFNRLGLLWSYPVVMLGLLPFQNFQSSAQLLPVLPLVAILAALGLERLTAADNLRRNRLALQIFSLGLGLVGLGLVIGGLMLYGQPDLWPEGNAYRSMAVTLGLVWLFPQGLWVWQRWFFQWQNLWAGAVLVGPLAAILVGLVTLEVAPAPLTNLPSTPIDFVTAVAGVRTVGNPAFYTPTPGQLLVGEDFKPIGSGVWWLAPEVKQRQEVRLEALAQVGDWTLVRLKP